MFARLRRLLSSLGQPSRFDDDPYGGLLNQWGHFTFGAATYILACCGWFFIGGEMPPRWEVGSVMSALYLLAWEIWRQGWRGRDTLEDWGYVSGGIFTVASSVQEVAATGWRSEIVVNVGYLAASIVFMSWACIAYAVARFKG